MPIAPNWWNFTKDPNKFLAARERLAEQILRLKRDPARREPKADEP